MGFGAKWDSDWTQYWKKTSSSCTCSSTWFDLGGSLGPQFTLGPPPLCPIAVRRAASTPGPQALRHRGQHHRASRDEGSGDVGGAVAALRSATFWVGRRWTSGGVDVLVGSYFCIIWVGGLNSKGLKQMCR